MALGAARMFNIRMPINFDSPYRATDIREFWHRWHITLSRFLRDYLYIPLGGNRGGEARTAVEPARDVPARRTLARRGVDVRHLGTRCTASRWSPAASWRRIRRPLPRALAWALTFVFVMTTLGVLPRDLARRPRSRCCRRWRAATRRPWRRSRGSTSVEARSRPPSCSRRRGRSCRRRSALARRLAARQLERARDALPADDSRTARSSRSRCRSACCSLRA